MAKKTETLEEGLNRSASKRGLTGKERHRYIGGALHNMGKAKTRSGKREPRPTHTKAPARPAAAPTRTSGKATYQRPAMTRRAHVSLAVRKNADASKARGQAVYSIYNTKTNALWNGGGSYRSASKAKNDAKIEQDAWNEGYKRSKF